MKIGIVTQPLIGNYGGIIQNYALQQVLINMGHEPITLDYLYGYSGLTWFYAQSKQLIAKFIGRKQSWSIPYAPKRNNKKINSFIDSYILHTFSFWNDYNSSLIKRYGLQAVIVGSDQVWRPKYNPQLHSSFLKFTNHYQIKRIAYAASFGTHQLEYDKTQRLMASKQLANFDAISVREHSGMTLVRELGAEAVSVLDPTLLLGREGFEKDLKLRCLREKDIFGTYILDSKEEDNFEIDRIKERIKCINTVHMSENMEHIGPKEWIEIIMNSRFFITDSFHGTIFCILFHVPFYTILNIDRGIDRFTSLLRPLGLMNRIKKSYSEIKDIDENIDWNMVDAKIADERVKSLTFLVQALS